MLLALYLSSSLDRAIRVTSLSASGWIQWGEKVENREQEKEKEMKTQENKKQRV